MYLPLKSYQHTQLVCIARFLLQRFIIPLKRRKTMDFIRWFLVAEDIFIGLIILAFFSLRKTSYTIASVINLCVLLFVNILLFQRNGNIYFLMVPLVICGMTSLIARPFAPQTRARWSTKTSTVIIFILALATISLVIVSVLFAMKLF